MIWYLIRQAVSLLPQRFADEELEYNKVSFIKVISGYGHKHI